MSGDDNNFPFDEDATNSGREFAPDIEELRQQIAEIFKKLTGENSEPATNNEILQFLRIINYNFISITRLLQTIVLKTAEMDITLINLELDTVRMNKHLQQFFDANSMFDEIVKGDLNVSGSTPDSSFIF